MMAIRAHNRPVMVLRAPTGSSVIPARVVIGIPSDPKATGAVLATRQMKAA